MRTRTRARGFTLVELMIVVAMLGILAGLAVSNVDSGPRAVDGAATIAAIVREGGRKAVEGGAVRDDVAASLGTTARTRMLVQEVNGRVTVSLERLVEDELPSSGASWVLVSTQTLGVGISIGGWTDRAVLDDGGAPEQPAGPDPIELRCYPEGVCDAATFYLQGQRASNTGRVAILPLGGSPVTYPRW